MLATDTLLDGRYRVGPVIGRGGGADVYRAEDLETDQPVAIKVLRGVHPDDLHRFEQEGRTLARLDHAAIVRIRDRGDHNGVPYLVLDLIDGEPLSAVLARGPIGEPDVSKIGAVLSDALAHAHEIGVVHRDVKPGNVLFDRDGDAHLTDFGIARLTDVSAITATGLVIGTAAYLAPEQVTGNGASPASDVYSLGLVLLETLTGERAYPGSASEAALARLHHQPEVPPTISRSLGALLGAMTASDPTLRPSAAAVAAALALSAGEDDVDATALLPVASDVTTAVPIAAAAVVPSPASLGGFDARRLRVPLIVAALIVVLLALNAFVGGGSLGSPATAVTPSTTLIAPTTTAPPTTVASDTTPPTKGKGKGKGGEGGEGG